MNKTPSNEGSSSGIADVKYQKAIKEISKLISLNTSLKKEIVTLQENYDKLRTDYETLQQKYNNLEFEMQQTKTNSVSTPSASNQHKQTDESMPKGFAYKDHEASGSISEFLQTKRKISDLEEKLSEKDEKIALLKRELDQKNSESGELYRKYLDVTQQLTKTKANQNIKSFEAMEKQRRKLKKQLQQSEEWVRKITNDYQLLKKQIMFNEKSSINAKSIQLGMSAPLTQIRDPLSDFYFEKLRKAQAENIRLKKQHNEKKIKLKGQLNKLKDENQQQLSKLLHLTSFVQKQQTFIQKFVLSQKTQNV